MNRQQRRAKEKQSKSTQAALPGVQKAFADALRHLQAGRLNEAERLYRQILAVDPDHADSLHLLGMVAYHVRHHGSAVDLIRNAIKVSPRVAFYHSNLGLVLSAQGKLDDAVVCYRRALVLQPDYVEAYNNLGNVLKDQGKLDEAVVNYRQAIALKPDIAEAHSNLGNALRIQGKLDEAAASYRQAIVFKPDYAEAYSNLGNALRDQGKLDEAVAYYRQALVLKPDIAEAHSNLGNVLRDQGKPDDALACYRRAIELKPDYVDALNNLALLLMEQRKAIVALSAIKLSLQIKEAAETKRIFVKCIKDLRFANDDGGIQAAVVRALTEPWCRPSTLARVGVDLVKLNPDISGCIARAAGAWPRQLSAQDLFGLNGPAALAANELLCALLCSTPIPDIAMERFLTMARRVMLDAAIGVADSNDYVGPALSFYSALARQCHINEYVFCHADDEIKKANELRDKLGVALEAKTKVPVLWVLAVASYFPLSSLSLAARLLDMQWPEPITAILVQQIREPDEELQLRATIPRLTIIEEEVSRLVRNQYEENPYPRWVKTEPAGNSFNIIPFLSQKFPLTAFNRHSKNGTVDFLIAGCGTGQHSIETAQLFKGARVLAVDLSLSSLGYAKRKTLELGLSSIDYAQADLLELGSIGRQFDVIGSVGVLHHLADPFAGLRVLLSLLRPRGFMNLGFYSELARRDIVKARAFIADRGYGATANEIRRYRQDLMDLDQRTNFGTTANSSDFYSVSTCRDLLFHAQEHLMTLTGIDAFLRDNNLAFLGFEIDSNVLNAYKRRFPDDPAATNLGQWQTFETENPDIFAGMYQFWIQKAG
jgi:tetratricopeptide (TPR) repeat protein/2-polyprenyl-3-methyl-5-hydroxy-6-metoxy-1,4-benzoquinol methylase